MDQEEKFVELIVVRGTRAADGDVKRGDKIRVPVNRKTDGVYPERWWRANKKAARPEEFEAFCGAVDVARETRQPAGSTSGKKSAA